jgi:hypothetical protein
MLACIAIELLIMLAAINVPCSVKTYGKYPPRLLYDGIAFCDTIIFASSFVN